MKYFIFIIIIIFLICATLFYLEAFYLPQKKEAINQTLNNSRYEHLLCSERTKIHTENHTHGCKIENNFSPTGEKWGDDCGRLIWAYSTIRCGEYSYFGWQSWNNSEDEKNVWIKGNQYYRSCQWPKGVSDEDLKSEDCKYDFLEAQ